MAFKEGRGWRLGRGATSACGSPARTLSGGGARDSPEREAAAAGWASGPVRSKVFLKINDFCNFFALKKLSNQLC